MFTALQRKTVMIFALSGVLAIGAIVLALNDRFRAALGEDLFWLAGLVVIGLVLLPLSGYVVDRHTHTRLKDLHAKTAATPIPEAISPAAAAAESAEEGDEIIGLARKIEKMARSLQQVEASYRAIVEDQADLICRFRTDGRLTFVNGAYTRFYGRKRPDFIGQTWDLIENKTARFAQENPWPESGTFDCELSDLEAQRIAFNWSFRAIRDREGNLVEYQAVGHDRGRRVGGSR
jgi:PAS domain-containing protein